MEPTDLRSPSLPIKYPNGESIVLIAADRASIGSVRSSLVKLQSYWLEKVFSSGDVIADQNCWALMQQTINLLPRQDNPAVKGADLEAIGNDYPQLERLFFADTHAIAPDDLHGWELVTFDMAKFLPCDILRLHLINHKQVLSDAEDLRQSRIEERKE